MKTNYYMPVLAVVSTLALGDWILAADNTAMPPVPGTVESADTKSSSAQNNTPRVNRTPNPEPASQPPGPESDRIIIVH